jgi:nucleotide-binding universal stress UspA family protein
MFHNILVAVDGSRHASAAINYATDLAKRYDATICLIHAFPHVSDLLGTPYYEDLVAARSMIGQQLLDAARQQVGDSVRVETKLLEGPPIQAILRTAEQGNYDLIVMGSRGYSQITGMLLGSVSNAVAQQAQCPVLVVHEPSLKETH